MARKVSQAITMEMEAVFTATTRKSDNGMTGVHYFEFDEIDEITFESVYMFGREWTETEMKERFGAQGADALIALLEGALEDDMVSWEEG